MNWIILIFAGVFEMLGVSSLAALQKKYCFKNMFLLVITFSCSFILLYFAMKTIPLGMAYAIWTGIGAVGGVILASIISNEKISGIMIVFITMIIIAIVGLKLLT